MKKTSDINRQILKMLRRSKWLIFIVLIILIPIYIMLTPIGKAQSSDNPPDSAIINTYNGTVYLFPKGQKKNQERINKKPYPNPLKHSNSSPSDILSIEGDSKSWAHLQLKKKSMLVNPIVQAGTDPTDTKYTFPCKFSLGGVVVGWGLKQQSSGECERIIIEKNSAWIGLDLRSLDIAEKATTKLNKENAQKILEKLKEVNINYSVAESAILEWIGDSDLRYYNIVIECLNILQNQRLKNRGAYLDVIFGYYKEIVGVKQLPQNPQINQEDLKEAIRRAYNDNNGTDDSFENILENVASIESQVQVSPTEDLTLIYAHNLDNNVAIDVLVGAVTIQAADNSGISVKAGSRYIYSGNGNQGSTSVIGISNLVNQEPVEIFLDGSNWSEDITPLINVFNQQVLRTSEPSAPRLN